MSRNASFDRDPEGYDALRQCWLNTRRTLFLQQWLTALTLPPGARVLELGSGTGWLLRGLAARFPQLQFVGIEPLQAYVAYASARPPQPNLTFLCAQAEDASLHLQGSFQAILSNDVLHHVESVDRSIRSAAALAAPRCRWMAIEPNPRNPYAFLGQSLKAGERNFRPKAFLTSGQTHAWKLIRKQYLFAIPPFIKNAPPWAQSLEGQIEAIPFIGGGIALDCERAPNG